MRTAILTIRKEPHYRRSAFESMLKKHDYEIVLPGLSWLKPRSREDLLVLWNKKRGTDENMANDWERNGGTVLVVENGYLQKVDKTYYAISVHGHNGSGWFPVGEEDRFTKLGFKMKPMRGASGKHVLVCGQRGIGSSLMASPSFWAERTANELRKITDFPVRVRAHPGNHETKITLEKDLAEAESCVIWSSGAGVRALVEGVPVAALAPHWICQEATSKKWTHCDDESVTANRVDQLHRMSHGQWHFDEVTTGEPLARILDQLNKATWPGR